MFEYRPAPKPSHNRRVKKKGERGKFSPKTIKEIFERDGYQCVRCGTSKNLESVSHHIKFRSQGGLGTKNNGATVCRTCHELAHTSKEVRKWFETWAKENLDENGERRG